jgi:superfamily I DNA/RNA helicase
MTEESRVFGPPGTGKTTYLAGDASSGRTGQIARAAEKYGPEHVLVTSFTRAAAVELASRGTPLPRENIGTLHSLGMRLAGVKPDEIADLPKGIGKWNEYAPHLRLTGGVDEEGTPVQVGDGSTKGDSAKAAYELTRATMAGSPVGQADAFRVLWLRFLAEHNMEDFTGVLERMLRTQPTPPPGIRVLFVDEAQDLTPLQFAIVRQWAPHLDSLILAGDDDQVLYEHLGASPEAFLNPPVPDSHKRVLNQSYRVPVEIQRWAAHLIELVRVREPKAYKPRDEEGEVVRSVSTFNAPVAMVRDAAERVAAGQSVMFLATCSYMLRRVMAELKSQHIPYHNPYKKKRGDWNPLRVGGKGPASRIAAYLAPQRDEGAWWTVAQLQDWTAPLVAARALTRGSKTRLATMARDEPDRIMAMEEIGELLIPEALGAATVGDLGWYREALLSTKRKMHDYPLALVKAAGDEGNILTRTPDVTVGTIHSVKGGEADCVYVLPDLSAMGMRAWAHNGRGRDSIIRQFYVAWTRARQSLVLCRAASHNAMPNIVP